MESFEIFSITFDYFQKFISIDRINLSKIDAFCTYSGTLTCEKGIESKHVTFF